MGEYWITHVRVKEKRIEHVKAFMQTIEGLSNSSMYDRNAVIQSIDNNDKWYTCLLKEKQGARNIWTLKAEIHVIEVDGEKFLRTDNNKSKADNLGELSSF
jgi:hypothetical protein